MNRPRLAALALMSAAAFLLAPAALAQPYTLGQRLSAAQVQALGSLPSVDLDGRAHRVLATAVSAQGLPYTTVLAPNGVVGQTFHEVLIAEMPTQTARARFADLIVQAASVQYQDHADFTVLRFATLAQAAAALQKIRTAQPDVQAGLPLTFSLARPQ